MFVEVYRPITTKKQTTFDLIHTSQTCRLPQLKDCKDVSGSQGVISDRTVKGCRNARLFINGKEEEITTLDHSLQDRLGNCIVGVDQNIEGFETVKLKGKVNYLTPASSEQGMSKLEAAIGHIWGNHRLRS